MEFSLDRFYQINRRIMIWIVLFALIWLLRGYFDIIFLVFVLCYLTAPVSKLIQKYSRLPHYVATTVVFLLVLVIGVAFFQYVTPKIVHEAEAIVHNVDKLEASAISLHKKLAAKYPYLAKMLSGYLLDTIPDESVGAYMKANAELKDVPDEAIPRLFINSVAGRISSYAPQAMMLAWQMTGTLLISLLFSYLISLDTARLRAEMDSMRHSRLKDFHEQTAGPVVNFANTLGRALQAQFLIACLNTFLTVIGLLFMGLPAVTALALIVFLCSFIPVLGVFISTTPMVLVALGSGDFVLALLVVGLIIFIHTIEAYILNPIIYGRHLRLNPVMVLIILYVGHRAFGVWGMLLGVPVSHYILHDVFGIQAKGEQDPLKEA